MVTSKHFPLLPELLGCAVPVATGPILQTKVQCMRAEIVQLVKVSSSYTNVGLLREAELRQESVPFQGSGHTSTRRKLKGRQVNHGMA